MSARVIVCGSRSWHDRQLIADTLNSLVEEFGWTWNITIVHGGATGADSIAAEEADKAGLLTEEHLPNYDYLPKRIAPLVRNRRMAERGADLCIAFWDGESTGTAHMLRTAEANGIPTRVVSPEAETTP